MSSDDELRRALRSIPGEEPSDDFVETLRDRLGSGAGPMSEPGAGLGGGSVLELHQPDDRPETSGAARRGRGLLLVAAAAVLAIAVVGAGRLRPASEDTLSTASTTEATAVGQAWLRSIVEADREGFIALHAADLTVDDTLMGFSTDTGILTPTRVGELYLGGFDALQAAVAIDDDQIRPGGCEDVAAGRVRCRFTTTLIGTDAYSYTMTADLTVDRGQIVEIDFTTTTDPVDLRDLAEPFFADEATDEDRACIALGFNTVGCGQHESDFMTRYLDYYRSNQDPTADG